MSTESESYPCSVDMEDNQSVSESSLFNYDKVDEQHTGEHSKAFYNLGTYYHGSCNPNDWLIGRNLKGKREKIEKKAECSVESEESADSPASAKPSKSSSKTYGRRNSNQTSPTVSSSLPDDENGSSSNEELNVRQISTRGQSRSPCHLAESPVNEPPLEIHVHDSKQQHGHSGSHQRVDHLTTKEVSPLDEKNGKSRNKEKKHHRHGHKQSSSSSRHPKHKASNHKHGGSRDKHDATSHHTHTSLNSSQNGSSRLERICQELRLRDYSKGAGQNKDCGKSDDNGTSGSNSVIPHDEGLRKPQKKELRISMNSKEPIFAATVPRTGETLERKPHKKELKISISSDGGTKDSIFDTSLATPNKDEKSRDNKKKSLKEKKKNIPKKRPAPLTSEEQTLVRRKCYMLYQRWGEPDREKMKLLVAKMSATETDVYVEDIDLLPWKRHGLTLSVKAMREK